MSKYRLINIININFLKNYKFTSFFPKFFRIRFYAAIIRINARIIRNLYPYIIVRFYRSLTIKIKSENGSIINKLTKVMFYFYPFYKIANLKG